MSLIGNILWFIFGGFFSGLSWVLSGIIWCITIIGIPYGRQCFKFASLSFAPFNKKVSYGGGPISFFANVIWIVFFGVPMAIENIIFGFCWCITSKSTRGRGGGSRDSGFRCAFRCRPHKSRR